jgi:hypothetical protein
MRVGAKTLAWWLRRLFLVLVAATVAAAVVVVVHDRSSSDGRVASAPTPASARVPRERDSPVTPPATPELRAATRAARRFLAGYLPYSYGRASAAGIESATVPLRRTLRRSPPRVPSELADDRLVSPRVLSLELAASNGDLGIDLVAVVDDGQRSYRLSLAVRPTDHEWLVAAVA